MRSCVFVVLSLSATLKAHPDAVLFLHPDRNGYTTVCTTVLYNAVLASFFVCAWGYMRAPSGVIFLILLPATSEYALPCMSSRTVNSKL